MSSNTYHSCAVRDCKNTSIRTPGKLWIKVPNTDANMRTTWLNLAKRDPSTISLKSALYFCEDHFDLENDMENYIQYKIMGSVRTVKMKPTCVPTKFDCQDNPMPKTIKPRKAYRRHRMANFQRNDNQDLRYVKKVDKAVQVSALHEDKAVQILLKCLNGACEAVSNGEGAKKSVTSSKNKVVEVRSQSVVPCKIWYPAESLVRMKADSNVIGKSKLIKTHFHRHDKRFRLRKTAVIYLQCSKLEQDMENYMEYKIMGSVKRIRLKAHCIPSRFDCIKKHKPVCDESHLPEETLKICKDTVQGPIEDNDKKSSTEDSHAASDVTTTGSKCDEALQINEVHHTATQVVLSQKQKKIKARRKAQYTSKKNCGPQDLKVNCPKCKTDVSHVTDEIQEDLTKALITKVFHYFEEELELLKKMTARLKLTHLSKLHLRTAQATGVSEKTVTEILQEEARRKDAKSYETPRYEQKGLQNAEKYQDDVIRQGSLRKRLRECDSQTERSNEETDDNIEDIGAVHDYEIKIEAEHVEPIMKAEPMEYHDEHPQIDPISIKIETANDEENDATEPVAVQPAASKRRKITRKIAVTKQSSQAKSSTVEESSHQISGNINVGSRVEVAQVKVEKIEIEEEGYS